MFGAYFSHSSRIFTTDDHLYNTAANFALLLTLIEIFVILLFMSETLNPLKRVIIFDRFCNNFLFFSIKKTLAELIEISRSKNEKKPKNIKKKKFFIFFIILFSIIK